MSCEVLYIKQHAMVNYITLLLDISLCLSSSLSFSLTFSPSLSSICFPSHSLMLFDVSITHFSQGCLFFSSNVADLQTAFFQRLQKKEKKSRQSVLFPGICTLSLSKNLCNTVLMMPNKPFNQIILLQHFPKYY